MFLYTGNTYASSVAHDEQIEFEIGSLINKLRPDAVSLSKNDFGNVEELANYITQLEVPVLAANLDISYVPELHNILNLRKWEIIDYYDKNLSIAVIGFLDPVIIKTINLNGLKILPWGPSIKLVFRLNRNSLD